ncbi:putative phosphotyrosyl phosphatase activator [Neospora caninum Liverpool]|uniref:Serine/threonine-protein phosphatase 2A activator n=1 Tax=Neospora caninum (strain Liverpool) TaxID=572307 RepID=F0VCP8_NEOCL|nr:putative phosphotyrosyl phosphatase activator [Neospora caninum Liverpool]CBZ51737.1 putative phosphotyrosyl phosphatase activator [Neospora caninum Liverpool]CEL65693.1 TPA: phosphotyrosyl phosphatase activator, putative [Neospora caninum Liverpool]|eukprot:XP_003881770.1 putative phosphotyrosyl phosphatase activator [Neospora caninum Liverpool]
MSTDPELGSLPSSSSSSSATSVPASSFVPPCLGPSGGVSCVAPWGSSSPLYRPPTSFSSPAGRAPPGVCCVAPWASASLPAHPLSGVHPPGSSLAGMSGAVPPPESVAAGRDEELHACKKRIRTLQDLSVWTASHSYQAFTRFLRRLSAAVVDKKAVTRREDGDEPKLDEGPEDTAAEARRRAEAEARAVVELGSKQNSREGKRVVASENVVVLLEILATLKAWVGEIPPIEQPMRFGNRAFRTWMGRLNERCKSLLEPLVPSDPFPPPASLSIGPIPEQEELPSLSPSTSSPDSYSPGNSTCMQEAPAMAAKMRGEEETEETDKEKTAEGNEKKRIREALLDELTDYFSHAFGDPQRIDYGTGHEVSFALFLFVLFESKILADHSDDAAAVLLVFAQYVEVCHALQTTYCLEPAGSRGAWGLDDFHFLPFLFGAAQLAENHFINPAEVADMEIVKEFAPSNLYFSSIQYIMEVKRGVPFSECAPMLYDISGVSTWRKIHSGLLKMYEGEVLNKFPIAQHFLFGSYFPFPSLPKPAGS